MNEGQYMPAKQLATEKLESLDGRKIFFFDLNENNRGVVLRIKEVVGTKSDIIMLPAVDLRKAVELMTALLAFYEAHVETK